jgi:hypothetical protein
MSWSANSGVHPRAEFEGAVDAIVPSPEHLDEHMAKQFDAAKRAVKALRRRDAGAETVRDVKRPCQWRRRRPETGVVQRPRHRERDASHRLNDD